MVKVRRTTAAVTTNNSVATRKMASLQCVCSETMEASCDVPDPSMVPWMVLAVAMFVVTKVWCTDEGEDDDAPDGMYQ